MYLILSKRLELLQQAADVLQTLYEGKTTTAPEYARDLKEDIVKKIKETINAKSIKCPLCGKSLSKITDKAYSWSCYPCKRKYCGDDLIMPFYSPAYSVLLDKEIEE